VGDKVVAGIFNSVGKLIGLDCNKVYEFDFNYYFDELKLADSSGYSFSTMGIIIRFCAPKSPEVLT
jgi:hypothetical protein